MPSKGSGARTGLRNNASLTSTSGSVPETEVKPYRAMTENQMIRLARIMGKKKNISTEDALAEIHEEEARRKKESFVAQRGEHKGKVVVRKRVPQRITRTTLKKRANKRKISEERKAELAQKRQTAEQALELRKAGVTYQKIADSLGYASAGSAKNAVDGLMRKMEFEAAKDVVLIDLQRLDEYQMRCTERLRNLGDLNQIDRLMRIMEMRYRILGVNEETTAELQQHFGINVQNKGVMIVQGTESDFVSTMMRAVGIDPDSDEGRAYVMGNVGKAIEAPPIKGEAVQMTYDRAKKLEEDDIIDAEIIEGMDSAYDVE